MSWLKRYEEIVGLNGVQIALKVGISHQQYYQMKRAKGVSYKTLGRLLSLCGNENKRRQVFNVLREYIEDEQGML